MGKTLYEKIWESHLVMEREGEVPLLYVDLHLIHEVTSPQAFDGLRMEGRRVRFPSKTLATMDHGVPTTDRGLPIEDLVARLQVETLEKNCAEFGVRLYGLGDPGQGIVHVIGPEQGRTLPGTVIVCGDSHTSTHGAFGALAFGIGTSEVESVLGTQTLQQFKSKQMRIHFKGDVPAGSSAKDLTLAWIGKIGTAGGTGHVIEFTGDVVEKLSMEGRMTLCNMSVEGGARAGLVAPDATTFEYLKGKPQAPRGEMFDRAVEAWRELPSDEDAVFDACVEIDCAEVVPQVTWGTSPEQVCGIDGRVPEPEQFEGEPKRIACRKALEYMGLKGGEKMEEIAVDYVFLGSCTNSRMEDLRAASAIVAGKRIKNGVTGIVVPGSSNVKAKAEEEGLDRVFKEAGFQWREAGCSMCLGMNPDQLQPGQRCASTSNRNFEGRQGRGGRTHLLSPIMAAAAAIDGRLTDVRRHL